MFHGRIPSTLSKCKQLEELNLGFNNLSGAILKEIGNLTKLKEIISTITNSTVCLLCEIPREIGNLPYLARLALATNNLVGVVPVTIFNMSALKEISLLNNSLSGSLPSRIDLSLPNVETLNLGINSFSGTIPSSITNSSKLSDLELGENLFSGFIPNTIGNLRNLEFVNIADNYLTSSTPELSFLSSLTNCKKLKVLIVTGNPLDGILPKSIGNFSLSLETILMANCSISGNIPQVVGNLSNLLVLELGGNNLTGPIPVTFSQLQTLQAFGLTRNKLAGPITDELCHLARLHSLVLQGNKFSGSIPSCLEGEIPRGGPFANLTAKSFMGNELLCGLPDLQVSPCKPNKPNTHKKSRKMLLLVIVLPLSTALIVVVTLTLKWKLIKCWKSRTGPSNDARLQDGMEVAVKVFHQQYERALKSFEDECEPSNVLLDEDMVAHISDFGIAKLLSGEDQLSKQTQTLATIGYMAPEYGTKGRVSTRGDVCSFGIMLMEIVWGIYFDKASHDEQISGIRIP
ncbi:LRR receptor-like serine/threonine-protein kinase FLS2 [Citrus clementina]|uniref:LRR receptor-like serine/threonine-protein kinase FLS2 n=1 Tax=Citrus clementina TaxID=85681 RepID=UPI000CED5951|nr:LRR receptor-like serine/threonine-protein kinase FLS2 [Citrus x clementina]